MIQETNESPVSLLFFIIDIRVNLILEADYKGKLPVTEVFGG